MTRSGIRTSVFAATLAALLLSAPAASADPTAADKAMAEALFRDAKELSSAGKLADACPKFAESHRLDPKPGTILNLAACHEHQGRTASAWADYSEAAILAARARQPDREAFARGKVDELEKKLSYVSFRVPAVDGLELSLDGKSLTTAAAGTRVPLDPGEHVIEARAPGREVWTQKLEVPVGPAERTVEIPELTPEGGAAAPAPAPAPPEKPPASSVTEDPKRLAAWGAVGLGVVGLGVGAFFGLRTLSEKSTVDDNCTGSFCNQAGLDANDRAYTAATLSTVGFGVGVVSLAAGVVLLVVTKDDAKGNAARARVSPALGPGRAGLALGGVW